MSELRFDVNLLQHIEPWQWPPGAAQTILDSLSDRQAKTPERIIASGLAGNLVVMNDRLAEALIAVVADAGEPDELRANAAISFGPVLELTDIDGYDSPFDDEEPPISEDHFEEIKDLLHRVYSDVSVPKDLRRRALEASVRAPQDWHKGAIAEAYASNDREWILTSVFAMRYVRGFEKLILEALKNSDEEIHFEAINAAGDNELDAAWSHVSGLLKKPGTPKALLLAAIEAVATIRPAEARSVLQDLTKSKDKEIAGAAQEAIGLAEAGSDGEEDSDGF